MTPDANFESISYNPFTLSNNFVNPEIDPDNIFYSDISSLDKKYFNPNKTCEVFEFLCKNEFSVLHARNINKNFEISQTTSILHLIARLMWLVFQKDGLLIIRFVRFGDLNFQIEKNTVIHQVREPRRGEELRKFVHKEVYFKPRTDLIINPNDVESLWTEMQHRKDKNILFNVVYRPSNGDITVFESFCKNLLSDIKHQNTLFLLMI